MTFVTVLITQYSDPIFLHHIMLWPVLLCHIFLNNFVSSMIFIQNVFNMKYVFWFFLQCLSEHFSNSTRNPWRIQWYTVINIYLGLHVRCLIFCLISTKLGFSWQILMKVSNITFHINQSSENWVVPCLWMDRHNEANSHCYRFWEHS